MSDPVHIGAILPAVMNAVADLIDAATEKHEPERAGDKVPRVPPSTSSRES